MGFMDKMKASAKPQRTGRRPDAPADTPAAAHAEPTQVEQPVVSRDEPTQVEQPVVSTEPAPPSLTKRADDATLVGTPAPPATERPADDTLVLTDAAVDEPPPAREPDEVDALLDDPDAPPGSVVDAPAEARPALVAPTGARATALKRQRHQIEVRRDEEVRRLGGLVVEMARRERMRVDLLAHRAAIVLTLEDEVAAIDAALVPPAAAQPAAAAATATSTTCASCGAELVPGANYCSFCGVSTLVEPAGVEEA